MRGEIGYLGGKKEMLRVGREIFINHEHEWTCDSFISFVKINKLQFMHV
jgi:hypothetical protein